MPSSAEGALPRLPRRLLRVRRRGRDGHGLARAGHKPLALPFWQREHEELLRPTRTPLPSHLPNRPLMGDSAEGERSGACLRLRMRGMGFCRRGMWGGSNQQLLRSGHAPPCCCGRTCGLAVGMKVPAPPGASQAGLVK